MFMSEDEQTAQDDKQDALETKRAAIKEAAIETARKHADFLSGEEVKESRAKQADSQHLVGKDRLEYIETGKFPTERAAGAAPKVLYGKIKGQEGTQLLTFNPRNPNGYVDASGKEYSKDQVELTGPPAPTDRLFGRSLEIAKIVEGE